MRTAADADRHATPRRRAQQDAADRADLADRLIEIDSHLQGGTLPPFLLTALQKERRRLLTEARAQEGGRA